MSEPLTLEEVYEKWKSHFERTSKDSEAWQHIEYDEVPESFSKCLDFINANEQDAMLYDLWLAVKTAAKDIERGVESIKQPEPSPATAAVSPLLLPHAHGV